MFTLRVFQLLLQDNPDLFTTEGLSSLLLDCICLKCTQHHKFTYTSLLRYKSVYLELAHWGGSGWATTAQIAEYFGTTESSVRELFRVNGTEFRDWETKTLTGIDLRDARQTLCLPSRTSQARVFSALGTLRIAMLLTESEIAAQVRTIILDLVSAVPAIAPQQPPTPSLPQLNSDCILLSWQ